MALRSLKKRKRKIIRQKANNIVNKSKNCPNNPKPLLQELKALNHPLKQPKLQKQKAVGFQSKIIENQKNQLKQMEFKRQLGPR